MAVFVLLIAVQAYSQGLFYANNGSAPTRMGSIDGPRAGPGIWGQMLAGWTPESLSAIDVPREHSTYGTINFAIIAVPDIPPINLAYVEMVAWDGTLWGTNLSGVPQDQLGRTDAVTVLLTYPFEPQFGPVFTQPAIVPVPEPSVLALGLLAAAVLFVRSGARHRARYVAPREPAAAARQGSALSGVL